MFYGAIGIFVETEKQTSPKAEGDEFPLTIIEKLNYHFPIGSLLRVQVFFYRAVQPSTFESDRRRFALELLPP
jgi:hypothetical protein